MAQKTTHKATQKATTQPIPELLRTTHRSKPLAALLTDAIAAGLPIVLPTAAGMDEIEDSSAIDPSLSLEQATTSVPPPLPGTGYAGLTPTQRHAFLSWCHKPEAPAPLAYQQLYLANMEARLLEAEFRTPVMAQLAQLAAESAWANNIAFHRIYLLACWLQQDGVGLSEWIGAHSLPADLLGTALGLQAMLGAPLTAAELGVALATWKLGERLPADLLKLRLDSLNSILGQPPLAYGLTMLDSSATNPRLWRTAHRGLRLLIPQPDLRQALEAPLRDLLAVADLDEEESAPISNLAALDTNQPATPAEENAQPSLEELGWRLILEFGSNRSEYFDYVLIQAQKLPGYSQLMDEDRRIVYRIIFRKSEMRRFWRIWDYVHGWSATRVYLNGEELEKWKVWPYSQYLR
ncbi:MAG: hypothetical protein IT328_24555 [Caldilineaceae bacterium]|nr:hypothetical protein [Caldilineaceae bacterium]